MPTPPDTLFTPLTSKRSFEEVSGRIKELIVGGQLRPGDRLPTETELAARFSVSRQTVREALRILELSGLVAVRRGGSGGPVVKNTIGETISGLFTDALRMEKITLDELTVARLGIERFVLSLVIRSACEEDLRALEDNVARARERLAHGELATAENLDFHRLLAKASKNYVLGVVVESILVLLRELLAGLDPDLRVSGGSVSCHEELIAAIRGKRTEEADRLMEEHVLEVRTRLQG